MEVETVTIAEACRLLGVSRAWLYKLIAAGRIRAIETGRGHGRASTVVREDVLKEQLRRKELLESRLRGIDQ